MCHAEDDNVLILFLFFICVLLLLMFFPLSSPIIRTLSFWSPFSDESKNIAEKPKSHCVWCVWKLGSAFYAFYGWACVYMRVCQYIIGILSLFLSFTPLAKWQTTFKKRQQQQPTTTSSRIVLCDLVICCLAFVPFHSWFCIWLLCQFCVISSLLYAGVPVYEISNNRSKWVERKIWVPTE